MLGLVIVKGQTTPLEAKLDRPAQKRPGRRLAPLISRSTNGVCRRSGDGLCRRADRRVRGVRRQDRRAALAVPDGNEHPRQPITFAVDGKQYVAIATGWGGLAGRPSG